MPRTVDIQISKQHGSYCMSMPQWTIWNMQNSLVCSINLDCMTPWCTAWPRKCDATVYLHRILIYRLWSSEAKQWPSARCHPSSESSVHSKCSQQRHSMGKKENTYAFILSEGLSLHWLRMNWDQKKGLHHWEHLISGCKTKIYNWLNLTVDPLFISWGLQSW